MTGLLLPSLQALPSYILLHSGLHFPIQALPSPHPPAILEPLSLCHLQAPPLSHLHPPDPALTEVAVLHSLGVLLGCLV